MLASPVCPFLDRLQNQQPWDFIKYHGMIQGISTIAREEGGYGLTKGIEASILRELSYSSIRFGGYEPIKGTVTRLLDKDPDDVSPIVKFSSALMSGGLGAALCSPLDLIKTR